ncbi:MAG: hypothetical protein AAFP86_03040 [Planctomycetota bacterium]
MQSILKRSRRASGGFALLELLVASGVLALGLVALTSATWRSHALTRSVEARAHADRALRTTEATIRAFASARVESEDAGAWAAEIHGTFGPGGTGTFDVPELDPATGAASVGTILLVTDETATDEELGVKLGMPRDLDGDGAVTNTDVGTAGVLYPVVLTAGWRSERADRTARRGFFLVGL